MTPPSPESNPSRAPKPRSVQQVLASHLLGGAGLIAVGLAGMVRDRGSASAGWVPGPGPATEALTAAGIPWHPFALQGLQRGTSAHVAALAAFAARFLTTGADIVHVHNPTIYGLLSPVLKHTRARTIAQFHLDPTRGEVSWALRHPPNLVITCSRHIATEVRNMLDEDRRTTDVVPIQNAIDIARFQPGDRRAAKMRLGAPVDAPLVVMMANLAEHKGQLVALRAIAHLAKGGVRIAGWFAGEERGGSTAFADRLRSTAADLGIADRVSWLGFRADGPEILRAADFFLLPSSHEGLPLSVLEAQASGAIVLGSPIPGISEVVEDGISGFLIPVGAPERYAERIGWLVRNPESAARIREEALLRVRARHGWSYYVDQVWNAYASLAR